MTFPDRARDKDWDLTVIGGGINGAGVARDAAMRGLDTILLEKGDFASGTSSRSTKLIHGGLRYLEHYEFGLVFESLRERSIQNKIASHLVKPRPFLFPIYNNSSFSKWELRLGLSVYDILSLFRGFGWHRMLSPDQARSAFPLINSNGLTSAGLYYDCQMDDSRLVLENVLDADRRGATVRNYCEVTEVNETPGRELWTLTVRDRRTESSFEIRTRKIVNATGPWSDGLARQWRDDDKKYLRPTRGSHIILPSIRTNTAGFFPSIEDDRLIFIIPWKGKTLVGTTDEEFQDDPDDVDVTDVDRQYLLKNANHYLDAPDYNQEDIQAEFAGLRPLFDPSGGTGPPGSVSRDHEIIQERDSIFTIVGGKYTTYRLIAEETLDLLGANGRCKTDRRALPGNWKSENQRSTYKDALMLTGELSEAQIEGLLNHYGQSVIELTETSGELPDRFQLVDGASSTVTAQIYHSVLHEYALTVGDVIRRRTDLFMDDKIKRSQIKEHMELARTEKRDN